MYLSSSLYLSKKSGFTLIELMIVMTIIIVLLGIGFFPYSYYMERARVEAAIDRVGQEWIIAHESVRNGKMTGGEHTYTYIEMKK